MDYLDIAVHDIHGVHVIDGIADTIKDAPDHPLVFQSVFSDVVKECAILRIC